MNNQNDVVIVSAVRTPFSKFGGALKEIHSTDLGVIVINESLKRAGMTGEDLDEVYYGMCDQAEAALYDNVNARQAILRAGLPSTLVSLTLDRACCSSLCAVQLGRRAILLNEADTCMAVGAENMSNTPLLINGHRWGQGMKPLLVQDYLNPITYREYTPLDAMRARLPSNTVFRGRNRMPGRWGRIRNGMRRTRRGFSMMNWSAWSCRQKKERR
jgi:acetyl-CoA C-acetyltransferase